jgi:thiol-disulfide isomerase/thioredoxin/Tfp pilus assembly protein PilF
VKRISLWIAAVFALFGIAAVPTLPARAFLDSPNTQAAASVTAQSEMKAGEDSDAKNDYAAAMAAYRQAIELDPQNADAHKHFIEASANQADVAIEKVFNNPEYEKLRRGELHGRAKKALEAERKKAGAESKAGDDALLATYDQWIATHSKTAAFYWAKGYALGMLEKPGEEQLFQKAISLDPKFIPAYNSMAQIEYNKGDYAKQSEYLKQVMGLDPANPDAARAYAESFRFSDPPQFRQLAEQFVKRFPRNSYATNLLYQLQDVEAVTAGRISLLEDMRRSYVDKPLSTAGMDDPDAFTNWLEESMCDLFNLYAKDNPPKALDLAQEMQKQKWADPGWKDAVAYQQNLIRALALIAAAKYSDATTLLQQQFSGWIVKYYIDHTPVNLAIAEAQSGAGNLQQAFDTLAAAWIKAPNAELKAGLLKYGSRLGKNAVQVDNALWQKWTESAKEMKPFELRKVGDNTKVKLVDFRGRVILVEFWFPLCGPCRFEMPFLNEVAKKYQSRGFAILAINGIPDQNRLAPGVLKNYDIIGLQVPSNKWADRYDHVHAYPTNYLLDAQGRIMAHPRVSDTHSLKAFETQLDVLLAHNANDNAAKSAQRATM